MMDLNFNLEAFIEAVEARPVLYNRNVKGYTDKKIREKNWIELCKVFVDDWDDLSPLEKKSGNDYLRKRWKSLKSCFAREFYLQKTPPAPGEKRGRQYRYYDQLSFLLPNSKKRKSVGNFQSSLTKGHPSDGGSHTTTTDVGMEELDKLLAKGYPSDGGSHTTTTDVGMKVLNKPLAKGHPSDGGSHTTTTDVGMKVLDELLAKGYPSDGGSHTTTTDVGMKILDKRIAEKEDITLREPRYNPSSIFFVADTRDKTAETSANQPVCKKPDDEIDEDKYFLLSLLPAFRKFNDEQKFTARSEILQIMRRVRLSANAVPNFISVQAQSTPHQLDSSQIVSVSQPTLLHAFQAPRSFYISNVVANQEPQSSTPVISETSSIALSKVESLKDNSSSDVSTCLPD